MLFVRRASGYFDYHWIKDINIAIIDTFYQNIDLHFGLFFKLAQIGTFTKTFFSRSTSNFIMYAHYYDTLYCKID